MRNEVNLFCRKILLMVVAMVGLAAGSAERLPFSVMGAVGELGKLTPAERAKKVKIALTGELTAEDFRILRDEMVSLEELDLTSTSLTMLPDFALAGHWKLRRVKLPASCTELGKGALMKCSQLSSVNLEHLTKIGVMALNNTALVEVKIPASVVAIGDYAFGGCRKLKKIEVEPGNAHYSSMDGVLFDKKQTVLFRCPEAKTGVLTLPETLVEIKDFACEDCKLLNDTLALPDNLQKIGKYAFDNCGGLEGGLVFPDRLQSVGEGAFWGCWNIGQALVIPEGVSVGSKTFGFMHKVDRLSLPLSLDALPDGLFTGCQGVNHISTRREKPAHVGAYAFYGIDHHYTFVDVPASAVPAYQLAEGWKSFLNYDQTPVEPVRFTSSGKYFIQYVGKGNNENRFIGFNPTYSGDALLVSPEDAPLWELEFFDSKGVDGAFIEGRVTDLRFTDGASFKHINRLGKCFADDTVGYTINANRQFAFWLNEKEGTVAIQSNGYFFTASSSGAVIEVVAHSGRPHPADYMFKLVPDEVSTGIEKVVPDRRKGLIYDLNGRLVPRVVHSGIYIIDGKKYYIKK